MRVPFLPPDEVAALVEPLDPVDDPAHPRRIARRRADRDRRPRRQQRGRRARRSPSRGLPINVVADDSAFPELFEHLRRAARAVGRHAHPVAQPARRSSASCAGASCSACWSTGATAATASRCACSTPGRRCRPGRRRWPPRRRRGSCRSHHARQPDGRFRVACAEPIAVASVRPGRAPASDPGDRRRASPIRSRRRRSSGTASSRSGRRPRPRRADLERRARRDAGRPARPRARRAALPRRRHGDRSRARGRRPVEADAMTVRGRLLLAASWLACRLPEGPLVRLAELAGDLWYRLAPGPGGPGAAQPRGGSARRSPRPARAAARSRAAATDPRALERLVRSAFRHARPLLPRGRPRRRA